MWGRLSLAGLLLAGCAFDPRGSSGSDPESDAGGGFSDGLPDPDGGPGVPDAAPPEPDSGSVEPVLLETLTIQADEGDDPVQSTVVLLAGRSYRLVASGVVAVRDDGWSGDADYYWPDDNPSLVGDTAVVDIGLAVNDDNGNASRAPDWGPFSDSHVYESTMPGNDSVLSAIFFDPNYGNNSGSLTLEIWGPPL